MRFLRTAHRRIRPQNFAHLQVDRHSTRRLSPSTVVKDVISELDSFLEKELRMDRIEGFIHKTLDHALLSTSAHSLVYDQVIAHLIETMWAQPAASVYYRMRKKGFITSDSIDAQILAILLADVRDSPDPILSQIGEIISKQNFKADQFFAVLRVLEDYNVNPEFILHLIQKFLCAAATDPETTETDFLRSVAALSQVDPSPHVAAHFYETFLANRDPDYVPSIEMLRAATVAFVQADRVDQTFALLGHVGIQPDHRPYHKAFLASLRDSRPFDRHSFVKLLSAMNDAGLSLDTSLLNILISREVRLKRAGQALFLYDEMKKTHELLPDSCTFGTLFAMYRGIRPVSLRQFSDATELAIPTLPVRHLFRDLVQSTRRLESPVKPTTTLLNAALRAFMRQRDYVAAIVVVQSFKRLQVLLDHKTYYCVVKLLVRRIWAEVQGSRPREQVRWVDRFLGVRHYSEIVLSPALVYDMVALVRQKDFDLSEPLYIHKPLRRQRRPYFSKPSISGDSRTGLCSFPTMEMMESIERPEPEDFVYEPVPLVRILSRAAIAGEEDVIPEEATAKLDAWVRRAESDMLPESCS